MKVHYFDFVPPSNWIGFRKVRQVRLIPPNTHPKDATCAIIVSPLVPKTSSIPPADVLFEQTLAAELQLTHAELLSKNGPVPTKSDTGLAGMYFDVRLGGATTGNERRLYVLLADDLCLYGLSYVSTEATFDEHVEEFWAAVRTIKPWAGQVIPPGGVPFEHFSE